MTKKASITDFVPQVKNPNKHTAYGERLLESSIQKDGWIGAQTAAADGEIIAGSSRQNVAVEKFADVEPIVVFSDGSRPVIIKRTDIPNADTARARRLSVAENHIAHVNYDPDFPLMQDWQAEGADVKQLFSEKEWQEGTGIIPESIDAEPQIDRAAELQVKWNTQSGQLWTLGRHKLLIGDCTVRENVDRLMKGERAMMTFTDPPYNVAYQDNESIESLKKRNRRTDGLVVSNDSMSDAEFNKFLFSFLFEMPIDAGGSFYLCSPAGNTETEFRNSINSVSGLMMKQCIVWIKDQFVFGRQDYHWRHESILYGWKEGAAHYFVDDHTQDTVWEINRPRISKEHPTMKPVELVEKGVRNSSIKDAIVYDPFGGSGTTLIACHNLGRVCRMLEISSNYSAVILERFHTAFPDEEIRLIE
jgi:DNA modification methylase